MLSASEILSTIEMISQQHLDIRTVTMGISLRDCADSDPKVCCDNIYEKICRKAEKLVKTAQDIEREFGIPIINKRVSVTPIAIACESCKTTDYTPFARVMDKAADDLGIDFIGGFSALVQKGFTGGDRALIESIPEALATTGKVCASVNIGSTKAGINMDAVAMMGRTIKKWRTTLSWRAPSTESANPAAS